MKSPQQNAQTLPKISLSLVDVRPPSQALDASANLVRMRRNAADKNADHDQHARENN
jgi:hypothetical protein